MNQRTLFDEASNQAPEPIRAPFARDSDTSKAAASAIGPRAATQRERVFCFIRARGDNGATDAEGETALGMMAPSYTPRRGELAQVGLIRDSCERRPTPSGHKAAVWAWTGKPYEDPRR